MSFCKSAGIESNEGEGDKKRCQSRHFLEKSQGYVHSQIASTTNVESSEGGDKRCDKRHFLEKSPDDVHSKIASAGVESNAGEGDFRCQSRHFNEKCLSDIFPPFHSDASSIVNPGLNDLKESKSVGTDWN